MILTKYYFKYLTLSIPEYLFIKSALDTTLTEEKAMAKAAIAGLKSQPVIGYKTP